MSEHAVPAVILAGGLGTRLRSVVADRPKVLAPVSGRPFITYLFDQLETARWRHVVLCTGYRSDQIAAAVGPQYRSLRVSYSVEDEPLGTAGALRLALAHLDADLCLVMNGDSYVHADLAGFLAWHQQHAFDGSILLTHVDDAARYGTVDSTDEGAITGFHEKQGKAEPGWINAGIYLLPRHWLEALPAGKAISIERDCFPVWSKQGLGGFRTRSPFIDIGTPESFEQAGLFINQYASDRQEHS
jgi:NDP-sugar pyrophosphorylase family protein